MSRKKQILFILFALLAPIISFSQNFYKLCGKVGCDDGDAKNIEIYLDQTDYRTIADSNGKYCIYNIHKGTYKLVTYAEMHQISVKDIAINNDTIINIGLKSENYTELDKVTITQRRNNFFGISKLDSYQGTAIYEGKKTEVIHLDNISANTATNNARQVFSKITGLNIWESDAAGLQLGIGARGLSPNRTANFNVRQNGYDISADALGYPESYYTPPLDAIEKVEFVRGAASLQYGTQLGGMINFVFKEGPKDKKIQYEGKLSAGSYGFRSTYNALSGTVGKTNYYAAYQYKQGNSFRKNSEYYAHVAYLSLSHQLTTKIKATFNFTHENYLAHQPGGLTDAEFKKDYTLSKRTRNWFAVNWNLPALNIDYNLNKNTVINWRFFALIASRKSVGFLNNITQTDIGDDRTLISDNFYNAGSELRLLKHYKFLKGKSTFVLGGRAYKGMDIRKQGNGSNGTDANFVFNNPNNLEKFDYVLPSRNYSVFLENIFKFSPRFSVTPGVRYEYINTQVQGYLRNILKVNDVVISDNKVYSNKSNTRNVFLYGVGMAYQISSDIETYINYTKNFRAATFSDILVSNPSIVVDPNLQNEKGFNADWGIRGFVKEFLHFDASIYYLYYNNRMGETFNTQGQRYRTNIGSSGTEGLEVMAELDMLRLFKKTSKASVSYFVNTSFNNARYLKGTTQEFNIKYKNKKVELVPNITLRTGLTYKLSKFTSTLQYSYISSQFSDALNTPFSAYAIVGEIPAYYVMDFSVKYQIKKYSIGLNVNNLTNNKYFTRRAESYPGPGILPSDPLQVFINLGIKL
jgi:Fe(3+) dicitrate transport protein